MHPDAPVKKSSKKKLVPVLIIVLVLTIPVAILAMHLAEKTLKKS